jgi:hypothetical protein
MFVVPALLGRAGYPPLQAAYAVNALYQVASFALVTLIAARLVPRSAVALGCILQLLPIAFVFRVRANQEYAVLAGLLFAIYATERARTRPPWVAGMLAGFCAVLLVKGVFAFMVPVACGIWLVSRAASNARPRADWGAWSGLALMPVAAFIVTVGYEAAYVKVTGRSFWRSTGAASCQRTHSLRVPSSGESCTRRAGTPRGSSGIRFRGAS